MSYQCRNCDEWMGFHSIYKKMICHKCYYKFLDMKLNEEQIEKYIENKKVEGKEMMKELVIYGGLEVVVKEYYLKVVEEKGRLEQRLNNCLKANDINYNRVKELEESISLMKDGEICLFEKMKEKDEKLKEIGKRNMKMGERIEELELELSILKSSKRLEDTWTLKYIYSVDGVVKEYEQNDMIKEDAEELIGMDSDNWIHYSLTKEERPIKGQVIEGLLIRCESNEELIKELEEKLIATNKAKEKYKELYHDSQRLSNRDFRA